jgi:hypothetical protein
MRGARMMTSKTETRKCARDGCEKSFPIVPRRGRQLERRYCSSSCRVHATAKAPSHRPREAAVTL